MELSRVAHYLPWFLPLLWNHSYVIYISCLGISAKGGPNKVSAYVDDLLFFVTRPEVSLSSFLEYFVRYGRLSNFLINFSKSVALCLNMPYSHQVSIAKTFPFKCQRSLIKYLGIQIPTDLQDLYSLYYAPLIKAIKKDLAWWSLDSLTWFGRNGVLKMNIMQRLLYIMQLFLVRCRGGPCRIFVLLFLNMFGRRKTQGLGGKFWLFQRYQVGLVSQTQWFTIWRYILTIYWNGQ